MKAKSLTCYLFIMLILARFTSPIDTVNSQTPTSVPVTLGLLYAFSSSPRQWKTLLQPLDPKSTASEISIPLFNDSIDWTAWSVVRKPPGFIQHGQGLYIL